jgi:ABC-type nitrate/sulfonate/bicarbonate transport system substrate-binding protein
MILLRLWLRGGGIDPDRDVRTIIVPPAQMVDSLANGVIEGFCVGEPWGSVAVHHGIGAIAALGNAVWPDSPEKVLCVTERWHDHHPATHLRLRLALMEACAWLTAPDHRQDAAHLLGATRYLDLPAEWLLPSLTGRMRLEPRGPHVLLDDVHRFGAAVAGFPWRADAELLIARCGEMLGRPPGPDQAALLAQRTSRPDLFRAAARHLGWPAPIADRLAGPDRARAQGRSEGAMRAE